MKRPTTAGLRVAAPNGRSYPSPSPTARQFGKVPLSAGVEKVSPQATISTMVAPSHRNEVGNGKPIGFST